MLLGYTYTSDNSGDVQCHQWGSSDVWLLSLTDTTYIGINNRLLSNINIRVYPNPADQEVIFELLNPQVSSGATLSIFNDLGESVAEFAFDGIKDKYSWNTKEILSGLYFYQLSEKDRGEKGKFLIKH
jgi:GH35 family endo-1,4-beta-xylanase